MRLLLTAMTVLIVLAVSNAHSNPAAWQAEGWATDFSRMAVPFQEIISGGPSKDGIPPIDQPVFATVSTVKDLTGRDPVLSLEVNGDARAYPLRVLIWHEIVNDTVGGKPVAITYCPLCNSAIVFGAIVDGKRLTFGTTGKLRKSDLVMYDRATESWWQQFVGEAIAGHYNGTRLEMLPSRLEGFADFAARRPDGKVLVPAEAAFRPYGTNPYTGYDTMPKPFLYDGEFPEGIEPMARVIVVRQAGAAPLIVSFAKLQQEKSFTLGGVTLAWREGQLSALDASQISESRDVGSVVATDGGGQLLTHDITFAFVAHAFHKEVEIVK